MDIHIHISSDSSVSVTPKIVTPKIQSKKQSFAQFSEQQQNSKKRKRVHSDPGPSNWPRKARKDSSTEV